MIFTDIEDSFIEGKILSGKVSGIEFIDYQNLKKEDAAIIFYDGLKIYIPISELGLFEVNENVELIFNDLDEIFEDPRRSIVRGMTNAKINFVITHFDKERKVAFGSRKSIKQLESQKVLKKVKKGDIIEANILGVGKNSVIAEKNCVDIIINTHEIAWGRVYNAADYAKVGDTIKVYVMDIDSDKKFIIGSRRLATRDPYDDKIVQSSYYKRHGEYLGIVRSIRKFGIFIELEPGITVLCNYPNWIGYEPYRGEEVLIKIKRFIVEERKINGVIIKSLK